MKNLIRALAGALLACAAPSLLAHDMANVQEHEHLDEVLACSPFRTYLWGADAYEVRQGEDTPDHISRCAIQYLDAAGEALTKSPQSAAVLIVWGHPKALRIDAAARMTYVLSPLGDWRASAWPEGAESVRMIGDWAYRRTFRCMWGMSGHVETAVITEYGGRVNQTSAPTCLHPRFFPRAWQA